MVYVNDRTCNGCGECVGVCPTGALVFQNNRAFIDQDICQRCEICLDACPQGAIISGEMITEPQVVIRMPDVPSQLSPTDQVGLRDMVLPAVGSLLLWTGRELVPRLADIALGYLDQRLQSSSSSAFQTRELRSGGQSSNPGSRSGRGRRRQRRCRNRRLV